ncbi:hypothetical protein [Streptomyces sp. V4I8]|uniref:hypothetical protein n=1 Tax=Streptomyces sp. V4I8 TaxID=3156469 RepID=UPI003513985E
MAEHELTRAGEKFAQWPVGAQVGALVGLLVAAACAGLLAQALAGPTRALWLGSWPSVFHAVFRWQTGRRRSRWHRRLALRRELERTHPSASRTAAQQEEIDRAAGRANNMAMAEPGRPTWMGDRVHSVEQVARDRYGLDLPFAWPRLWLVLPDTTRAEITAANGAFVAAVAVGSWAWLAALLAVIWWPAAPVAVLVAATGWVRARSAVTDLAALAESALDVHGRLLAEVMGVAEEGRTGPLTLAEGAQITAIVRKGR